MVLTRGEGEAEPGSTGGVAVAPAGTTVSPRFDEAGDREAQHGREAAFVRGSEGTRKTAAATNAAERVPPYSSAGEATDYPPLPVFRQSVSSTLTGPGSGSLMNGNDSNNGSSSSGGGRGGGAAAGADSAAAAKGKAGAAGRGAALAGKGLPGATRKEDTGAMKARGLATVTNTSAASKATTMKSLQSGSTRSRSGLAVATTSGVTSAGGAGAAAATAPGAGGRHAGVDGNAAAAAATGNTTSGARGVAATGGRGVWTTLFRSISRDSHGREAAEQHSLLTNSSETRRDVAAGGGGPDESVGSAAAVLTSLRRGGRRGGRNAGVGGMEQQEGLTQQKENGKEEKARRWMLASLVMYFFLGLLVLYCISYANIEWCCIFVIFGVVIGGMGLAGLRNSSRLLLLIHVATAAALLFTLFVAWCYNVYVLLRAVDVLVASSWPPLHHQQFKYYYSIPTAYESPPAPWVEEVLLMRLQYPSEDAEGIRKLIGEPVPKEQTQSSRSSRGKKAETSGSTRPGSSTKPATSSSPSSSSAAAEGRDQGRRGDAAGGGTAETPGKTQPEAEGPAKTQATGDRGAAAPATPAAAASRGRRLAGTNGDAAAAAAATTEQRGQEKRRGKSSLSDRSGVPGSSDVGWKRRLEETRHDGNWRRDMRSRLSGPRSTGIPPQESRMQGRDLSVGEVDKRGSSSSQEEVTASGEGIPGVGERSVFGDAVAAAWGGAVGAAERRRDLGLTAMSTWQRDSNSGALSRRLAGKAGATAAGAEPSTITPMQHDATAAGATRDAAARPGALRRLSVGDKASAEKKETDARKPVVAQDAEAERKPIRPAAADADRGGGRTTSPSPATGRAPVAGAASAPPAVSRRPADAGNPTTAAAGSANDNVAAVASSPRSSQEGTASAGQQQQLRGKSGPAQQLLQEKEDEENDEDEDDEEDEEEERETPEMVRDDESLDFETRTAPTSLSSTLSYAATRSNRWSERDVSEQRRFSERDAKGRNIIKGCVEGAESNPTFLNDASHAMSSLATRGWLCAFARAEILPFHRWPVDCHRECGYAFLDAGHDLHASNYYDMTRVAEYLIQISSLSPKRLQQCVDYAAATVCSIKNRNFFVVWVVLLVLWLLFACVACTGIMPFSLYNTVQVIKTMQQP